MEPVFWVTCDKHPQPVQGCQRCATALDSNLVQAAQLGLPAEDLDAWGRKLWS